MKTFRRFKNIINANVNAKLDKLEDPEKMIRLMLSELDETLVDAKTATAERTANRTVIEEELKQAKAAMERWNNRASLAVEKGRDDLAREALIEKTRVTRRVENLEGELAQMDGIISSMQDQISKLETKRQEIRDKQRMLIERAYHAKEKQKVVEILKNIDCSAACRKFNELEEKIERMEADVEMAGFTGAKSKEQEFVDMEHNEAIEAELAKLKAKHTKKQTN